MWVGIDLAWSPRNKSGVAVYDGKKILHTAWVKDLQEIIWIVMMYRPGVVAIDAPLHVHNETGNRKAEQELNKVFRKFDAGAHPANRTLLGKYNNGLPRGEELEKCLNCFTCIEVYPHAASIRYFNLPKIIKYKRDKTQLPKYEALLKTKVDFNLETTSHKEREDILDAIMCALVAKSYADKQTETYGGEIVVPIS